MKKQKGLTLIELLLTIALAAVLLTVGIPLFSHLVDSNRLVTSTNQVVTALNLARSEAVKRGRTVTACSLVSSVTALSAANCVAAPTGIGSGDYAEVWNNGWLVFADEGVVGTYSAADDVGIRIWPDVSTAVSIKGDLINVQFRADGSVAAAGAFELVQTEGVGSSTHCVSIRPFGQIRSTKGSC